MEAYLLDWLNLGLRWLHLIAGVAWIGASFYFVMLDSSLDKPARSADVERGVAGELWAVHGGGVYHSQKYLVGPVGEICDTLEQRRQDYGISYITVGAAALRDFAPVVERLNDT